MTTVDKQLSFLEALSYNKISTNEFLCLIVEEGWVEINEDLVGLDKLEDCLLQCTVVFLEYLTNQTLEVDEQIKKLEEDIDSLTGEELESTLLKLEQLDIKALDMEMMHSDYTVYMDRFSTMITEYRRKQNV